MKIWRLPFTNAHLEWALEKTLQRTDGQKILVITDEVPPFKDAVKLADTGDGTRNGYAEALDEAEAEWARLAEEQIKALEEEKGLNRKRMAFLNELERVIDETGKESGE